MKRVVLAYAVLCLTPFTALHAEPVPSLPSSKQLSTGSSKPQSLQGTLFRDEAEQRLFSAATELASSLKQGNTSDVLSGKARGLAENGTESWLGNLLSTDKGVTEISLQGATGVSPTWSFLFVRPVTESRDLNDNTFFQGSVFRQDGRTTLNAGYGYRRLVADQKVLLGTNLFYDHEFPYHHQRMSVGGEVRTTVGEINANWYKGLTDWKDVGGNIEEKAMGGYDAEIGLALPYIPSAHMRYKNFQWTGVETLPDLKGNTFSLTGTLYQGLSVELGYTSFTSGYGNYALGSNEKFVKVSYNIAIGSVNRANRPRISDSAYSFDSMADKRFEKVRRENRIIKAVRNKGNFTVSVSGY